MPGNWNEIAAKILRVLAREGRYADLVRRLVLAVLILLVAQPAAELTWLVLGEATAETSGATDLACEAVAAAPVREAGERIDLASLHLFGQAMYEAPEIVSEAPPAEAPQTTLSLVLKGVIAASSMSEALAIISEKGKGEDLVYAVGDEVPGQARLEGIYADRVLLRRAGQLETLYLEEPDQKAKAESEVEASSAGTATYKRLNRAYVERSLANIPELAKEVGVEVYSRNGRQHGYKLVSAKGSRFLDNLGLKAGDVLYEVNGISLSSASGALTAYEKLKDQPEISLVIERDGQRQTKTFSIH